MSSSCASLFDRSKSYLFIISDASGNESQRCILPIAMIYYIEVVVLAAWCEVREDFRHFRVDRIVHSELLDQYFRNSSKNLRQQWHEIQAR